MVLTRVYLPSSGAAPISPAVASGWDQTASVFARMRGRTTVANTALTNFADSFGPASTSQTCAGQWVIGPFLTDGTLSGTVDIVVAGSEGSTSHNIYLALAVRVVKPDGTERGSALFHGQNTGGSEYGTATRTRIWADLALTSTAYLAGDYLVVEVGPHGQAPASGATFVLIFGDPTSESDWALTTNLSGTGRPWVEFDTPAALLFGDPLYPIAWGESVSTSDISAPPSTPGVGWGEGTGTSGLAGDGAAVPTGAGEGAGVSAIAGDGALTPTGAGEGTGASAIGGDASVIPAGVGESLSLADASAPAAAGAVSWGEGLSVAGMRADGDLAGVSFGWNEVAIYPHRGRSHARRVVRVWGSRVHLQAVRSRARSTVVDPHLSP